MPRADPAAPTARAQCRASSSPATCTSERWQPSKYPAKPASGRVSAADKGGNCGLSPPACAAASCTRSTLPKQHSAPARATGLSLLTARARWEAASTWTLALPCRASVARAPHFTSLALCAMAAPAVAHLLLPRPSQRGRSKPDQILAGAHNTHSTTCTAICHRLVRAATLGLCGAGVHWGAHVSPAFRHGLVPAHCAGQGAQSRLPLDHR